MHYNHFLNPQRFTLSTKAGAATCVENLSYWDDAVREIHTWPEYKAQPLRDLKSFAHHVGIDKLYVKDESMRFGTSMASFKALGAPYAVYKILAEAVRLQTGIHPSSDDLRSGKHRGITQRVTVCVATDGNQGRGLAYGAKIFGCRCVNYIHNHVSTGRAEMMKDLGAIVIRIDGEYEESVERAKEDARMNGWHFVSSTSWSDFDHGIPQNVMNAYMVVVEEALTMLQGADNVTHVFVCGGVGSIAAAVFHGFFKHYEQREQADSVTDLPRFVVVEPSEADCLLQSARKGEACLSPGTLRTLMAGLACRGPSPAALKILLWLASDFIAVPDSVAIEGMNALARGDEQDIPVVVGESSAASMGIMLRAGKDPVLRGKLGLNTNSRVILFGLEGATDPELYEKLVGMSSKDVFEAQARFVKEPQV